MLELVHVNNHQMASSQGCPLLLLQLLSHYFGRHRFLSSPRARHGRQDMRMGVVSIFAHPLVPYHVLQIDLYDNISILCLGWYVSTDEGCFHEGSARIFHTKRPISLSLSHGKNQRIVWNLLTWRKCQMSHFNTSPCANTQPASHVWQLWHLSLL